LRTFSSGSKSGFGSTQNSTRPFGTQAELLDEGGNFDEERSCDVGDVLTGYEVERASLKHGAGEVAHEGTCLEMKVAEHYIRAPTTNKLNNTVVNTAIEQGHGAASRTGAKIVAEVRME
jgi:hypothetical protein